MVVDFTASIPAGTITTVIGPNGAGKSTLLRAIAGTNRHFGGGVKLRGVLERLVALIILGWIEIAATAEPPFRRRQHPRVHVRGRAVGIFHVGDEADAARPEARIVGRAFDLFGKLRAERAVDGGGMHADFLEHAASHHAHHAAAAFGAGPWLALEGAGRLSVQRRDGRQLRLQPLQRGADVVAQALEPAARRCFLGLHAHVVGHVGKVLDLQLVSKGFIAQQKKSCSRHPPVQPPCVVTVTSRRSRGAS